ncbi:reverse transcriptase domain-containing protein [Tanacetum coccineum]
MPDPCPDAKTAKDINESIMASCPFYQWGMDILGPLPQAAEKIKFVIVSINYFTKCIEAKPLAQITRNERRLGRDRAGWVNELPNVLWAHLTSLKQSNGETPFNLTYGSAVVIPTEIGMPTHRMMMIKEDENEEDLRQNMDLLQERREAVIIREAKYKSKMEQYYI